MSHQYRGSREQVPNDVESELQEAMSENVLGEESLLDGQYLFSNFFNTNRIWIMGIQTNVRLHFNLKFTS